MFSACRDLRPELPLGPPVAAAAYRHATQCQTQTHPRASTCLLIGCQRCWPWSRRYEAARSRSPQCYVSLGPYTALTDAQTPPRPGLLRGQGVKGQLHINKIITIIISLIRKRHIGAHFMTYLFCVTSDV